MAQAETETLWRVSGRKRIEAWTPAQFRQLRERFSRCLIDIGTGDGGFVLRYARAHCDWLAIGVDANAEGLARSARRAGSKPARGGVPNALFLRARVEEMPHCLHGEADKLTLFYPWGGLLRLCLAPDSEGFQNLVSLGSENTVYYFVLNESVFASPSERARLALPPLETVGVASQWREAGLHIVLRRRGEDISETRWGKRLILGSRRKSLYIVARRNLASKALDGIFPLPR